MKTESVDINATIVRTSSKHSFCEAAIRALQLTTLIFETYKKEDK